MPKSARPMRTFSAGERAEPHVGVRIGDAGNDRTVVKIDDLGFGLLQTEDFGVRTDGIDARAGNRECLRPRRLGISGVDMAVNEDRVSGESSGE